MDKPSIYIAVPAYGGMIQVDFARALFGVLLKLREHDVSHQLDFLPNRASITHTRNVLANRFYRSNHSHLLFLDADLDFDPRDVISLIGAEKDVVVLPYCRKLINWDRISKAVIAGAHPCSLPAIAGGDILASLPVAGTTQQVNLQEPVEIKEAATGIMLIARNVFSSLAEAHPDRTYKTQSPGESPRTHFSFFHDGIEDGTGLFLSEDYAFCQDWRNLGGKIYMLPWATTVHTGSQQFTFSLPIMQKLGVMLEPDPSFGPTV